MVAAGVTGILNVSPCRLRYPEEKVVVNNRTVAQEFEKLICEVNVREPVDLAEKDLHSIVVHSPEI